MATIKKGGPHGLWKILIQLTGTDGVSYGQAGSSIANDATSQSFVVDNPRTASLPQPARTTIAFGGGDRFIGQVQYGIDSPGEFTFTTADMDDDLKALVTGTAIDQTTNDTQTVSTADYLNPFFPECSIIFIYRKFSMEASTFGRTFYAHRIFPRCQIAPQEHGLEMKNNPEITWTVTPNTSSIRHDALSLSSLNAYDDTVLSYEITTEKALYWFVHRADGTSFSAASAYVPVTSTVGTTSSTRNLIVEWDGSTATKFVANTITPSTGTFEVSSGATSGDLYIIGHETEYVKV